MALFYLVRHGEESFALAREFTKFKGEYPPGKKFRWESLSHKRKRINPGEIIECTYRIGQAECEYSFT